MFRSTFKEGRYEVLSRIGLGGMAEVFRVYDTTLEVERALKVLNVTASTQVRLRIEREAKVMAKLTHSNIVRIIDLFSEEGIPCIVMELCSGSTEPAKFWTYRDEDFGGSIAKQSKMRGMWKRLGAFAAHGLDMFKMKNLAPRIMRHTP